VSRIFLVARGWCPVARVRFWKGLAYYSRR
jgi:hypothetical protein